MELNPNGLIGTGDTELYQSLDSKVLEFTNDLHLYPPPETLQTADGKFIEHIVINVPSVDKTGYDLSCPKTITADHAEKGTVHLYTASEEGTSARSKFTDTNALIKGSYAGAVSNGNKYGLKALDCRLDIVSDLFQENDEGVATSGPMTVTYVPTTWSFHIRDGMNNVSANQENIKGSWKEGFIADTGEAPLDDDWSEHNKVLWQGRAEFTLEKEEMQDESPVSKVVPSW